MATQAHQISRNARSFSSTAGITITELLAVMAILAILLAASVPAVSTIVRGNRINSSLQTISGLLEKARGHAITNNTYVWVAFSEEDASEPGHGPAVALIASHSGDDPLAWTDKVVYIASEAELQLIDRVYSFPGVNIVEADEAKAPVPASLDTARGLEPVQWEILAGGKARRFNLALQFGPAGVSAVKTFCREIALGVIPEQGNSGNSAVIRISSLTGKASVFRPN